VDYSASGIESAVIDVDDVKAAAVRIASMVRPVVLAGAEPLAVGGARVSLALEYMQHTGSFKARGAANLALYHREVGSMPEAGVVIASGGNAGVACAWAAQATGTRATVFVPATAPEFKVAKLRSHGARVEMVGTEYAHALEASIHFAEQTGALLSHAYDHPLIAAGAGTLAEEIIRQTPEVDSIVVAVGGGGLFSGVAAAARVHGVRVVAVEPERCRALNAALEAGAPVDGPVDSVAADSLGARRVSRMAFELARQTGAVSVLVADDAIVRARQELWDERRIVVEYGGATALAAIGAGVYVPAQGENVVVVLCGANTEPADLTSRP
jgi:threonine dehydratase